MPETTIMPRRPGIDSRRLATESLTHPPTNAQAAAAIVGNAPAMPPPAIVKWRTSTR